MKRDIRETPLYREAARLYEVLRQPGTGRFSDSMEVDTAPDGAHAVFAAALMERLEGSPLTRICQISLESGALQTLSFGPGSDRAPRYSPDGRHVAFLSDRASAGDFQLYLLDLATGDARPGPRVEGWVEYLQWSADGARILLGVAGHGADVSGGQGAISSKPIAEPLPSWLPAVETEDESFRWRRVWIYDVQTDSVRPLIHTGLNTWEAVWCGIHCIAAVVSSGPREGHWYRSHLALLDVRNGDVRKLYVPEDQIGAISSSPSGKHIAVVEAVCSDRWYVAGNLLVIDSDSGDVRRVDTNHVDVTHAEWRSESRLLLAGHRNFETVVGLYDLRAGAYRDTWASEEVTTGGRYISVSGLGDSGDCVLVGEGFVRAPELSVIRAGHYRSLSSFDTAYREESRAIGGVTPVRWRASDGLEIQGWLLTPQGKGPHPLVMNVHGGPVWHSRPRWLGRAGIPFLMLLRKGCAVFFPNPRGSTGRGQDFARCVLGDMGGADTGDFLSGLDWLVAHGHADTRRLGVTGISYGGFMTSWLITQDTRFAAAVPVAPTTNQVTQHLISNIPHFVELFLGDSYTNPTGKYFQRSPVMHVRNVRTPTLNICGALDRCTPPEEAVQFHRALLECGVKSALVTYPEEGHGVRKLPAAIDYAARLVGWFAEHLA